MEMAVQGLRFGAGLEQLQAQREDRQWAREGQQWAREDREAAQMQAQREQEQQAQASEAMQRFYQSDLKPRDFLAVAEYLPKHVFEGLLKATETMNTQQRENLAEQAGTVFAAFEAGRDDIAREQLVWLSAGYRKKGDEQAAGVLEALAQSSEIDPRVVKNTLGTLLGTFEEGRNMLEALEQKSPKTSPEMTRLRDWELLHGRPATDEEAARVFGMEPKEFKEDPKFGAGLKGRALTNLTDMAETFGFGLTTPDEDRLFESSATAFLQPERDPDTGTVITPVLPPFVQEALNRRGYTLGESGGIAAPVGEPGGIAAPVGEPVPEPARALPTPGGKTIFDMNRAGWVTGPVPQAARALGIAPVIGALVRPAAMEQAKRFVSQAGRDLIRVLQSNPKYAIAEMERIEKDISMDPAAFDTWGAYENHLIGVDATLEMRLRHARETANSPHVGRDERVHAMNVANGIKNFREILGVPPRIQSEDERNALPSGTRYIDPAGNIRRKP